jgi:hypothetical protein
MNDIEKKEPDYALGVDVDGSDSIDTITALVAEGLIQCMQIPYYRADRPQIISMRSNFGPCHGTRPPFYLPVNRSAWRLWPSRGPSRELSSILNMGETDRKFSVLGWVPGIITMILCALIFWYTSTTMHKYIMKYPQIKDICECRMRLDAVGPRR